MAVTELDVTTNSGTNSPSATVLASQANQYAQLFKCFVERSYRSGRGKIINVSKDGLNDQYTFVTNQSSSLWNTQNQCKPAFFAVVSVGINYNGLDSLISYADTLKQGAYTPGSWSIFAAALASAKSAKAQNYSSTVSADTALANAKDRLTLAINQLDKSVSPVDEKGMPSAFGLSQNYPNPFNPSTVIGYTIGVVSHVRLEIFDLLGRHVAILADERKEPGEHTVTWDAHGWGSGVYLYRMTVTPSAYAFRSSADRSGERDLVPGTSRDGTAGTFSQSKTMLLMK
jgi:hypothetical protein